MGVRVVVTLYAPDPASAERAAKAGFQRFAELEDVMSDYRPSSEVSRLCARAGQGPVPVSPDLLRVLSLAEKVSEASGGAFDVTCGPVVKLWRDARKSGRPPDPTALSKAVDNVWFRYVNIQASEGMVAIRKAGVRIDLGAIGKGYACEAAVAAIAAAGVERAMVEAGGDLAVSGPPPGTPGWRVAVRGLRRAPFVLQNAAVSTSGDAEQFVVLGGRRYSHIVDPRTGRALSNGIQATVVAASGAVTDSLSTALCVLGEAKGRRLAESFGAQAFFVHQGDVRAPRMRRPCDFGGG